MTDTPPPPAAPVPAEDPFIVWTFRRTGGTTLRSIFFWLSRHAAWQDEAFNRDRELGAITRGFEESGDRAALDAAIAVVAAERRNLKHCIETVPYEVTSSLFRHASAQGYRHLVLLRLNEVERQLSLSLARSTGAWGPAEAASVYADIEAGRRELGPLNLGQVRRDLDRDAAALGRLMRLILRERVAYGMTFFEDLYTGPFEQRLAEVRRIAGLLGLSRADQERDEAFRPALMDRSQGTRDILRLVPNLAEAEALVRSVTE
jgi:hypothetical protein